MKIIRRLEEIASAKKCSLAQLSLAWLLSRGDDIVPIVGTRHSEYLEENLKALQVRLGKEELSQIDRAAPPGAATGPRYHGAGMQAVNR